MPIHDWSRVDEAAFHAFHLAWLDALCDVLNDGRLPEGLSARTCDAIPHSDAPLEPTDGEHYGVAEIVRYADPDDERYFVIKRRRIDIHCQEPFVFTHVHVIVPRMDCTKDGMQLVPRFIQEGHGRLILDVHPESTFDPGRIEKFTEANVRVIGDESKPYRCCVASYRPGEPVEGTVHLYEPGDVLADATLYLDSTGSVVLPLQETYDRGVASLPCDVLRVLEASAK